MQNVSWGRVSGECWSLGNALPCTFQEAVGSERIPGSSDRTPPCPKPGKQGTRRGDAASRQPPAMCWAVRFSKAAPGLGSCGGDAKEAESVGRVGRCGDLAGASRVAAAG